MSSDPKSVLDKAVEKTPGWVFAFSGGLVVMSICVIAILQFSGASGPLQRIGNAYATKIERAAERIENSSFQLEEVLERIDDHETRIDKLEDRVTDLEREH